MLVNSFVLGWKIGARGDGKQSAFGPRARKETGTRNSSHLIHPNFRYGVTYEALAAVSSGGIFDVTTGIRRQSQGDDQHPGSNRCGIGNAIRVGVLDAAPLMGVGTDDSHGIPWQSGLATGRGWVMVRARYLTPEHLIRAMKRGDFLCFERRQSRGRAL